MPTIYDNFSLRLLDGLRGVMQNAIAADFCVGYFNLRGWQRLADLAESLEGTEDGCCRVLVGMQKPPEDEAREAYRALRDSGAFGEAQAKPLYRKAVESFRAQITFGVPTNEAETALNRLALQLRSGQVRVKLFLKSQLHAKLYLVHRTDSVTPLVGFVGSSNLTQAGLTGNGELNVDVLEQDAAQKLHEWFHDRWEDDLSYDISADLAQLIEEGWSNQHLVRPYLVYLKMLFHLSEDARAGEKEFRLPKDLQGILPDFQTAAVSLAARHLHARGGVLLGDVVGLGKTFIAVAIARILEEDTQGSALIICPASLVSMWESYKDKYDLKAKVLSLSKVQEVLPNWRGYRLLIIDESHNLRNRDGLRYQVIRDYIEREEPRCLLISATPYNKAYADLSNQLRLFINEKRDLGVRPEKYFEENDEGDFAAFHQASPRSLTAFELSDHADDWRDLMRLYMVRRTRRFIIENYAQRDPERDRHFVLFPDGTRFYFPLRKPASVTYRLDEDDPDDQYARLYRQDIVDIINSLDLPRYGLERYIDGNERRRAADAEERIMKDLGRAGRRLLGYCRTNLFKRLESSGASFLLSVNRHVLRNMVTLYAIANDLPVPIGTQDAAFLDTATRDDDPVVPQEILDLEEDQEENTEALSGPCDGLAWFEQRAAEVYQTYSTILKQRFKWLPAKYFTPLLAGDLRSDAKALCAVLEKAAGQWDPQRDAKLDALHELLSSKHGRDKVLVFTQFADTARYLAAQLKARGIGDIESVTGFSDDSTALSRRFSPLSNEYALRANERELRVLIATDVLSEGQNLQDCHVVVNYDLPWAIIRLVQRAGRVDRIGQRNDTIYVYLFRPATGVEHIIHLESRLKLRLLQNNEVVGSDEQFFEEQYENHLRDLYTERAGALDEIEVDSDVDLASEALSKWNAASESDQKAAQALPPMVNATRLHEPSDVSPAGVLVYMRTGEDNDALVRIDTEGRVVSQSLSGILREAACPPETVPQERDERHHGWVEKAVQVAITDENLTGGALGPQRTIRRRTYERLNGYFERNRGTLLATQALEQSLQAILAHPLTNRAKDAIRRQMRVGIGDEDLVEMVTNLHEAESLVVVAEATGAVREPQIVCSLGLTSDQGAVGNGD